MCVKGPLTLREDCNSDPRKTCPLKVYASNVIITKVGINFKDLWVVTVYT